MGCVAGCGQGPPTSSMLGDVRFPDAGGPMAPAVQLLLCCAVWRPLWKACHRTYMPALSLPWPCTQHQSRVSAGRCPGCFQGGGAAAEGIPGGNRPADLQVGGPTVLLGGWVGGGKEMAPLFKAYQEGNGWLTSR